MMAKSIQNFIQYKRLLSWSLTVITGVMLASGYYMAFFGADIPLLRGIHFFFDFLFALTFTAHLITNTFILRFKWIPISKSGTIGKLDTIALLRLLQRVSSLGLLFTGALQIITGLDWFKRGLSRLLPYPLHREIDLILVVFLITHITIAIYFTLIRRRLLEKETQVKSVNLERREIIALLGGAVFAFIAALFLNKPRNIGIDNLGLPGTLPPGQREVERLNSVTMGIGIPPWDPETWRFEVSGNVNNPFSLSLVEFRALPRVIRSSDFHCVTGWTKFDNKWEGVSFRYIKELAQLKSNAKFATIECLRGYTTSLPISELSQDDVIFAYRLDDKELPSENGGPLRLVVPKKYGYKSAKWVTTVKFTEYQELGYWEMRGYSNTADPYTNDRYSSK